MELAAGKMNPLNEWQVGYRYNVIVTHINDPKSFFVRMTDHSDLMNIIERPSSDSVSASTIKLGLRVVYKSKRLNKFVRGQIHYIKTDKGKVKCDIYAIDYGCFDKSVSERRIHSLDSNAEPQNQCPGLATHCRLYLCEPRGAEVFSEEVIDTMRQLVDKQYAAINVINKISDQLVVELMSDVIPRDMASFLAMVELTVMTKGVWPVNKGAHSLSGPVDKVAHSLSALNLIQTLKYKHKQLNVGDKLHVRVQSGTSLSGFYVAEVNDLIKLRSAAASFSEYVKNRHMKVEDFVPGRVCAVKQDNLDQYERAIIKKVDPNSTAVLELVDWGKEIESNLTSIRSIDKDSFLTLPIIAMYCATSENQNWSPSFPLHFMKRVQFGIQIVELGNNSDKPHKVNFFKPEVDKTRKPPVSEKELNTSFS